MLLTLRHTLLDRTTENDLIRAAQSGDKRATTTLLRHNQALIHTVVRPYALRRSHLQFEDLMQAGNEGLLIAIERFDPNSGYKLSTYATTWIRQRVTRTIANSDDAIRLPVHMQERSRLIRKTIRALTNATGKAPTLEQVAAAIEETVDWVMGALDAQSLQRIHSIDAPVLRTDRNADDGASALGDFVESELESPEEYAERMLSRDRIEAALSQLPSKWAQVIRLRFGFDSASGKGLTHEAIGSALGFTKQNSRILERKAMKRLQAILSQPQPSTRTPTKQQTTITENTMPHNSKGQATRDRITQAINDLKATGEPFTVGDVITRAQISDASLYTNYKDLAKAAKAASNESKRIARLNSPTAEAPPAKPQLATPAVTIAPQSNQSNGKLPTPATSLVEIAKLELQTLQQQLQEIDRQLEKLSGDRSDVRRKLDAVTQVIDAWSGANVAGQPIGLGALNGHRAMAKVG